MDFLKNIINKLFNTYQEEKKSPQGILEYGDQLKDADIDYKFAQLFTMSGGIFNYCADEQEAVSILKNIVSAEKITSVFCCDEILQKFLSVTQTPFTPLLKPANDAAFITCEYLIAHDGRITLSYNNILNFQSFNLPEKIIIMANISQIVDKLETAMAKLKKKGMWKNLTSISGSEAQLFNPNKKNPKLFLLLLED